MPEQHPPARDLSSYLDGALPGARARATARHLEGCAHCARELAALRRVKLAVGDTHEPQPRPAWLAQVRERVASGSRPASRPPIRIRLRRRVAAAGALLAAAGLGLGLWLAPPPATPESFQDEVREHLVQMDNPLGDQTSYVLEAQNP
jgi:anti-sigma factor RsiW